MVGDGSKKVQGSILNGRFDFFFFRIVINVSLFLFESGLSWGAQTQKFVAPQQAGSQFPNQEWNPRPPALEGRLLITGTTRDVC